MGLMKKLTSAVVTSSLVLGAVSTAFAAPAADEVNAAYARLNHYNVVQGIAMPDGTVSPALEQNITRAQLITIVTRAFGQEENAKLLRGAKTGYSDVDGNVDVDWATGYIFMGQRIAAQKNITIGLPGGVFAPSKNVSQIEALAFIMKFLGIEVGTGDTWVETTIANAKAAGLITGTEVQKYLDNPNAAANRGLVFGLLDNIFSTYNKLEGGKTVYTSYVDTNAPELNITAPALSTDKESIEIIGAVKGEFSALYVGSEKIAANADGSFSYVAPLNVGANAITFTVVDRAGNSDEATFSVTRSAGVAAKITASLASTIVAGSAADLSFEITDANGIALEVPATDLTVVASAGTYADGKYTASEKAGTATVTVSYGDLAPVTLDVTVTAGALANLSADKASVAKGDTIKLTATDKFGNAIASGVTYSVEGEGIAVTNSGVVYTSASGKYTVTAKAGEATATTTVGVYADAAAVTLATADSVVANGTSRVKVVVNAVDEFGNTVANFANTNAINLSGTGVTFYDAATAGNTITSTTLTNGTATVYASVSNLMAGETVTLNAVQNGVATVKGETTLKAVAAVATAVKVEAGAKTLAANQVGTESFSVKVVDQAGVDVDGVYSVSGTINGVAKLTTAATATYAKAAGSPASAASFTVSNAEFVGTEGTITGTFTVEGIGSGTATISHIIAGNPQKLAVTTDKDTVAAANGAKFKYTVELQDRNGVGLKAASATNLTISLPDTYEAKFQVLAADGTTVITPNGDGTWTVELAQNAKTADFYVQVNGKYTGPVAVSVKGTVSGVEVTGAKSVSVTTGAAAGVAIDREGTIYAPVAAPTATFVASLADFFGNAVAAADVELSVYAVESGSATNITVNGKNATASDTLKVKTNAEGKAVLELTARPYTGHTYDLVVSYTKDSTTWTDTVSLGIVNQVASSMTSKIYKSVSGSFIQPTSIKAGEEFYMVVSAKDNYGGAINLSGLTLSAPAGIISLDGTNLADGAAIAAASFSAYNAMGTPAGLNLQSGDHWIKITAGKSGVVTLGASYGALQTAVSTQTTAAIQAGAVNKIVANNGEEIEVTGTSKVHGPYTMSFVDAFGNLVPLTTDATITVSAPAAVSFRAEAGGATVTSFTTKSSAAFYFTSTTAATHTVTVSTSVDTDGNGTPEIYNGSISIKVSAE